MTKDEYYDLLTDIDSAGLKAGIETEIRVNYSHWSLYATNWQFKFADFFQERYIKKYAESDEKTQMFESAICALTTARLLYEDEIIYRTNMRLFHSCLEQLKKYSEES